MHGGKVYDDGEGFAVGDDRVDWSRVDELSDEYARVLSIDDDDLRLAEARRLVAMLEEGDG